MARDYAKSRQGARKSKAGGTSGRRVSDTRKHKGNGLRFYLAGVITGVFLSFLVYLGTLPGSEALSRAPAGEQSAVEEPPKPRFDFYEILPERSMDVDIMDDEVEPAADVDKPAARDQVREAYLLQAGSFRQREDADRRRAELLLLGLEPRVEEARGDNGQLYRVYLGPFNSQAAVNQARALVTQQGIESLLLKRGQP